MCHVKVRKKTVDNVAYIYIWNVSGKLPLDEVITEFLKLCIEYDSSPNAAKYCVQMMLRELQETPRGKKFLESQTLDEIW